MRLLQLLAAASAIATASAALPDALEGINGFENLRGALLGRQDRDAESSQAGRTTASAQPTSQPSASGNRDSSAQISGSAKASQGTKVITGSPSNATSFDPRLPAGGISMITPNAVAGEQYFKVGDWVTFAWNYTSLSVTPSAIDVLATCTANQATYTIAVNMSATETKVLWNTKETPSGQAPFLTEMYTLLIYDAESSVSAVPRAGYLGVYNQLQFGMYTPQPKVDWDDFQCANCIKNSALSHTEKMTLYALLTTTGTTVASLLYFTYTFGLW